MGIIPLFAVEVLDDQTIARLPGFQKRLRWFLDNRRDLAKQISYLEPQGPRGQGRRLLAIPSRPRLERILRYVLDENEFLSPFGVRSLSRVHKDRPYTCSPGGTPQRVDYEPGDATTSLFGGNSNWRGPIWLPVNYLLVEALERYHHFYGDTLRVECPTGSGRLMNLQEVARDLATRLVRNLSSRRARPADLLRIGRAFRHRSALARSRALSRVFSRRLRPWARRQPSDRLDRAGNAAAERLLCPEGTVPIFAARGTWRRESA